MSTSAGKSLRVSSTEKPNRAKPAGKKTPSASYLVRFWLEPGDGGEPSLRGYVRHLATGEESYIGDPTELGEHILKGLPGSSGAAREESVPAAKPGRG